MKSHWEVCEVCDGLRQIHHFGPEDEDIYERCPECDGRGGYEYDHDEAYFDRHKDEWKDRK